jgi:hypothetical protein
LEWGFSLVIAWFNKGEGQDKDKYLLIGFDRKGSPLEILYNIIDEDTINVFHAMKCRKNFLPLIKIRGENNGWNDRRRSVCA